MPATRAWRPAAVVVVGMVSLSAAGCGSEPRALDHCLERVAGHTGVPTSSLEVTSTIETRNGAFDWEGTYSAGTFACASSDGATLDSVVLFDREDGGLGRAI